MDRDQSLLSSARELARDHVARACSELPPGSALEQLKNFCGRGWEILRTPSAAALHRLLVAEAPSDPDLARFYAEEVQGPVQSKLAAIIASGVAAGEFRPVPPRSTARFIMAALLKQAYWCNHAEAFGPALGGGGNRVVADTLSIVLEGLLCASSRTSN